MATAIAEVMQVVATRRTADGVRMGDEIETIRKEGPFTQQQVADRLQMSLQGYLGYRKGYQRVTRNTIQKWANALDVPLVELARRLEISLLAEPDASGLRQQLAALLPDASAAEMERTVRELAQLPPHLREKWFEMQRWVLNGLRTDSQTQS